MARFWTPRKRLVLWLGVGAVAIVLVVLVTLVAAGVLVLKPSTSATITVSEVELHILQGSLAGGGGWFGPSFINYTAAEGYPIQVAVGGSWSVSWMFDNLDNANHTVYTVGPTPPFTIAASSPALPHTVAAGADRALITFTLGVPGNATGTYAVTLTVDALPPA